VGHAYATAHAGSRVDTSESVIYRNGRERAVIGAGPAACKRSASTRATYPDDAIIGVPCWWAYMAPQQQEQQLQMA
jgi:hypothetical protein